MAAACEWSDRVMCDGRMVPNVHLVIRPSGDCRVIACEREERRDE